MPALGVLEIFYGRPWADDDRLAYAEFLKQLAFDFYLYGPKADDAFRKNWTRPLTTAEMQKFRTLKNRFHQNGLRFGIILSPHGLNKGMTPEHAKLLQVKIEQLNELELDHLGLFFDDMASSADLAARQIEIAALVQSFTHAQIIFCPSFYSSDSLLDMLFGERPKDYLQQLGKELPKEMEIVWTGEQIISPEISSEHLKEVGEILRRKPFLCDNLFANDGPINCPFLKLTPPAGRSRDVFSLASHWALNPMNQNHLSKILIHAFAQVVKKKQNPQAAFESSVHALTDTRTADFILSHAKRFSEQGLESLPEIEREKLRTELSSQNPYQKEILDWLAGLYAIDFLAMIEQSCYVGEAGA
jgi:hypothetical protein